MVHAIVTNVNLQFCVSSHFAMLSGVSSRIEDRRQGTVLNFFAIVIFDFWLMPMIRFAFSFLCRSVPLAVAMG